MNKTIFITGAASGIGRETARLFARRGWYTGLYDLNREGLMELQKEIGKDTCCVKQADVTSVQSMKAAMKHFAAKTGGKLDVLFPCAGVLRMGYNEDVPISDQHLIIDINVKGVLNTIHAGLDMLKKTEKSKIIMMSSVSALWGTGHLAIYSATKAAINSLTESLNMELEHYGIFVGDIRVPYVNTPMLEQDVLAASIEKLGIPLDPPHVAELVWKSANKNKIHRGKGMLPFYILLRFPSSFIRWILKKLILPSKGKK